MPTKDQVNAALRHVYTAIGALVAAAVALGLMGQGDADKVVALVNDIGGSVAVIVGAIGALLPILSAARAAWSASHTQQIKKVESIDGVVVTPVSTEGAALIKQATGADKPVQN